MNAIQYNFIVDVIHLLNEVELSSRLLSLDVKRFVACQSALETGYGSSKVYLDNNNLFGMRDPKFRPSFSLGPFNRHALFVDSSDSVSDYMMWLLYNRFSTLDFNDVTRFADHLSVSSFNPSNDYVNKINQILKTFQTYEKNIDCKQG